MYNYFGLGNYTYDYTKMCFYCDFLTHQRDYNNLFKPFMISEIIVCPYLINAIDIMKLLFYPPLVEYIRLVI